MCSETNDNVYCLQKISDVLFGCTIFGHFYPISDKFRTLMKHSFTPTKTELEQNDICENDSFKILEIYRGTSNTLSNFYHAVMFLKQFIN